MIFLGNGGGSFLLAKVHSGRFIRVRGGSGPFGADLGGEDGGFWAGRSGDLHSGAKRAGKSGREKTWDVMGCYMGYYIGMLYKEVLRLAGRSG